MKCWVNITSMAYCMWNSEVDTLLSHEVTGAEEASDSKSWKNKKAKNCELQGYFQVQMLYPGDYYLKLHYVTFVHLPVEA